MITLITIYFLVNLNLNPVICLNHGSFLDIDNVILNDEINKKQFPYISCPLIFDYVENVLFGGYFGLISLPNPFHENEITLEVDMSYNGIISTMDNIQVNVLSTDQEVLNSKFLQWAVIFPFQDNYPKILSIKLNGKKYCTSYPDPVISKVKQTTLWAKSVLIKEKANGETIITKSKRTLNSKKRLPTNYLPGVPVFNPKQEEFLLALKRNAVDMLDLD
ncbi:uncharacterized protein [Onthophagus taurus]|uniref:uncharacterized protein n=1 Tax=Onthophagus taurus TaxID=166361 RepID=UPI0039BDCFC3